MDLSLVITPEECDALFIFSWNKVHMIPEATIKKDKKLGTTEFRRLRAKGADVYLDLILAGFADGRSGHPLTYPGYETPSEHVVETVNVIPEISSRPIQEQQ